MTKQIQHSEWLKPETETPTGEQLRAWRKRHGLRQADAARFCYASERSWQGWESDSHPMPQATWELLLIKSGEKG